MPCATLCHMSQIHTSRPSALFDLGVCFTPLCKLRALGMCFQRFYYMVPNYRCRVTLYTQWYTEFLGLVTLSFQMLSIGWVTHVLWVLKKILTASKKNVTKGLNSLERTIKHCNVVIHQEKNKLHLFLNSNSARVRKNGVF